jgi:hypothetical protein
MMWGWRLKSPTNEAPAVRLLPRADPPGVSINRPPPILPNHRVSRFRDNFVRNLLAVLDGIGAPFPASTSPISSKCRCRHLRYS